MAFWRGSRYEVKKVDVNFSDGLNTKVSELNLSDSELSLSENFDDRMYPSLATRYGYIILSTIGKTALTASKSDLALSPTGQVEIVSSRVGWQTYSGLFNQRTQSSSVGSDWTIMPYKNDLISRTILWSTVGVYYADSTSPLTSTALALTASGQPTSKHLAIHKNRIFAADASDNIVYYTALNTSTDWTTAGDAGDFRLPYNVTYTSITAITSFKDKLLIFTASSIHELYGDSPDNFSLIELFSNAGCSNKRSIANQGNYIIFGGTEDIYLYDGSTITVISDKIKEYYRSGTIISAGFYENKYYATITSSYKSASSYTKTFVYNPMTQTWFIYDLNPNSSPYAYGDFNTYNYILTNDNLLGWFPRDDREEYDRLNATTETQLIPWKFETKMFSEGVTEDQSLSKIKMVCEGSSNTSLNIRYTTDMSSTSFTVIPSTFGFSSLTTNVRNDQSLVTGIVNVPSTILSNDKYYKLRFDGSGPFKLHRMEKWYRIRK